ncbi:hypothetical protein [Clostridium aciditolerans]|uniref:Uncharacterized protein n=1 Tax=Clostridium aciditolerans TaxID=339861 RepID=A0A934M2P2_9CLOT|nr:hypothetical protein [Clostridium aciditolerans]MBI6874649.1 hypothetical protein [Clostridium aciditolerans]
MAIDKVIIDKAIEILEDEGILFEDSSEVGKFLTTSNSREELSKYLDEHFRFFDKSVTVRGFNILSRGEPLYLILVWDILETFYSQLDDYYDVIKKAASIHYGVPENDIFLGFM